ncbi:MAG: hypothetical protein WDM90_16575 [Ferruginibacter sp.]
MIDNEKNYQKATERFEEIKDAAKGSIQHKEKLLLAFLINQYEEKLWDIPELDPIELIKIRMEDFGYNLPTLLKNMATKEQ